MTRRHAIIWTLVGYTLLVLGLLLTAANTSYGTLTPGEIYPYRLTWTVNSNTVKLPQYQSKTDNFERVKRVIVLYSGDGQSNDFLNDFLADTLTIAHWNTQEILIASVQFIADADRAGLSSFPEIAYLLTWD